MSDIRALTELALALDRLYLTHDRAVHAWEQSKNRKAREAFRQEAAAALDAYVRLSESPIQGDARCVNCGKWTEADRNTCRSCGRSPSDAVFAGEGI